MTDTKSQSSPLVSVIVTTYNRPELCKRALESVQSQSYDQLEVIVVEDGTNTGIDNWVDAEEPDWKYIRHNKNRGLAAARNTGLKKTIGNYVAFLDDDDEWKPDRIAAGIEAINSVSAEERNNTGVIYCGVERRNPNGEIEGYGHPENEGDLADSIQQIGASTLPSTFLFRRSALEAVNGFDESLPSSIDHDMWMKLATHGYRAITIDEPLVITYINPERKAMTSNTIPRIYGVKIYVNKWEPTYRKWFGAEAGDQYADQYFADVISRLARKNLLAGSLSGFLHSISAIIYICRDRRYALKVIFWQCIAPVIATPLPAPVVEQIKRIRE